MNRLRKGTIVTIMSTMSSDPAGPGLAATDDHAGSSRVSRWMGRTVMSTRTMSSTASAEATPTWRPKKAMR